MRNIEKYKHKSLNFLLKIKLFKYENLIFFIALTLILLKIILIFKGYGYTWDLDHAMYFGNRLNYKELIFTFEYYDKLPIVQYLFYIPGAFKNVNIWLSFNLFLTIISSIFVYKFINNLIYTYANNILNKNLIKKIILFAIFIYYYLILSIEGNLYHINATAINFSILSNYLFFSDLQNRKNFLSLKLVLSVLFAALSISIRPYLALPILILPIWIKFRKINIMNLICKTKCSFFSFLTKDKLKKLFIKNFIWLSLIFIFGLSINVLPYIFSGNLKSFISGIFFISQKLHPWTPLNEIFTQSKYLFKLEILGTLLYLPFLSTFLIIIYLLFSARKSKLSSIYSDNYILLNDIIFFGAISPLLIQATIIYKHYFHHYNQFFIFYSVTSLALYLILIFNNIKSNLKINFKLDFALLLLLSFFTFATVKNDLLTSFYKFEAISEQHYLDSELQVVSEYLEQRKDKDLSSDFLHPYGMYIHWKLEESRKGFPHSANLGHINNNDTKAFNYGINGENQFSPKGVCDKINKEGPSIIFISEDKPEETCIRKNNTYFLDKTIKNRSTGESLSVFIKK